MDGPEGMTYVQLGLVESAQESFLPYFSFGSILSLNIFKRCLKSKGGKLQYQIVSLR